MNHKIKNQRANIKISPLLIFLILFILVILVVYSQVHTSIFWQGKDRINVLIYDERPWVFSLDMRSSIQTQVNFSADKKVIVPGGYGEYRIGALGKLSYLEKKPVMLRNTFALNTHAFIDRYFYRRTSLIYYENNLPKSTSPIFLKILSYQGDANLIDRLYLAWYFTKNYPKNLREYTYNQDQTRLWYRLSYRTEKKRLQIIYHTSYATARNLSDLIEGNGIRVVDLTYENKPALGRCVVTENEPVFSQTANDLAWFFHCQLIRQKSEISDIILYTNASENDWEVNGKKP